MTTPHVETLPEPWAQIDGLLVEAAHSVELARALVGAPDGMRRRVHMARAALNKVERALDDTARGSRP